MQFGLAHCSLQYGSVVPQGIVHLKQIEAILDAPNSGLPALVREECRDLIVQIAEKAVRMEAKTKKIKELAARTDTARRLQTMPGVGPMTALAFEAFAPEMSSFRCGRDLAVWLGLVPRQHSSGRQGAAGACIQGRPDRHPPIADHRGDVTAELAGTQGDPCGFVAGTDAGDETTNVGCDRFGQQDVTSDLVHADDERGLSESGVGCDCVPTCIA